MDRNCQYTKRVTLKDGTIKEYTYTAKYETKTNMVKCGKNAMKKRITDCKDKEKLETLKQLMDDLDI